MLPILRKTWQFDINQQVGSWASALAGNQSAMFAIKESLVGFLLHPWVVWGSNDGSGLNWGNNDYVDWWTDPTKLIWAAAGNHSWAVLEQPSIGSGQICIDLFSATTYQATIVFSPGGQFGAPGSGGTGSDGTATARPTAGDELVLLNTAGWGGSSTGYTWRLHAMMSTDGTSTRILMQRQAASVGFWFIDTLNDTTPVWTYPVVAAAFGVSDGGLTGIATLANFGALANYTKGRIGSDLCSFYITGESYSGATMITSINVPDDDSLEWPIFPVGVVTLSAYHRGRKGRMNDLWWGANLPMDTDTYPDDTSYQFMQFGDFIVPWNGVAPLGWT